MSRLSRTYRPEVMIAAVLLSCGGMDGVGSGSGGGASQTGGASQGASSGVGGSSTTGGSGALATGGEPTSGGSTSGSGGNFSTGGSAGGASAGGTSTGGRVQSGGLPGLGGSGGTSPGSGGALAAGGSGTGATQAGGTGGASGGSGGGAGDDLCEAGVFTGTAPAVLQLSGQTFAHDPTMVKVDGTYYRFWTGEFIPMATSTNLTNWSNGPSVYGGTYSPWVGQWLDGVSGQTFNFPWAPDVSVFGGEVHLYSSFSARFGDNISCITHLSTGNIAGGQWTDHGPVICTEGNENYNAIDADVALDEAGTPWLAFGSFWDGIMAFPLNADGSRQGDQLVQLANSGEIEAPVLFRRCGYYYLFVTFGLCCPGEGRSVDQLTYRVVVGRSEEIDGPYVDRNGTSMLQGGGTPVTQGDGVAWAAAGHSDVLVDGDQLYHLYHAYSQANGNPSLRIAELFFDEEGWPVPHDP